MKKMWLSMGVATLFALQTSAQEKEQERVVRTWSGPLTRTFLRTARVLEYPGPPICLAGKGEHSEKTIRFAIVLRW